MTAAVFLRGLRTIVMGLVVIGGAVACSGPTEPHMPQDDDRGDPEGDPDGVSLLIDGGPIYLA